MGWTNKTAGKEKTLTCGHGVSKTKRNAKPINKPIARKIERSLMPVGVRGLSRTERN